MRSSRQDHLRVRLHAQDTLEGKSNRATNKLEGRVRRAHRGTGSFLAHDSPAATSILNDPSRCPNLHSWSRKGDALPEVGRIGKTVVIEVNPDGGGHALRKSALANWEPWSELAVPWGLQQYRSSAAAMKALGLETSVATEERIEDGHPAVGNSSLAPRFLIERRLVERSPGEKTSSGVDPGSPGDPLFRFGRGSRRDTAGSDLDRACDQRGPRRWSPRGRRARLRPATGGVLQSASHPADASRPVRPHCLLYRPSTRYTPIVTAAKAFELMTGFLIVLGLTTLDKTGSPAEAIGCESSRSRWTVC